MSSKGLNKVYNDTIYNQVLNCENGYLTIINNSFGSNISFAYTDLPGIDLANSEVTAHPNQEPSPTLELFTATD